MTDVFEMFQRATGMFDPPLPVPDDASLQTKLLAAMGRRA
jgi:hypothetical protein